MKYDKTFILTFRLIFELPPYNLWDTLESFGVYGVPSKEKTFMEYFKYKNKKVEILKYAIDPHCSKYDLNSWINMLYDIMDDELYIKMQKYVVEHI
jgi:hypothetical protein